MQFANNLLKMIHRLFLAQLENATDVPVHPYNTAGYALDVAKRTLLPQALIFDEIVKMDRFII